MQVQRVDVLATEATRKAKNGHVPVDAIRALTGYETRVLSGDEEATNAASGVISGFSSPRVSSAISAAAASRLPGW